MAEVGESTGVYRLTKDIVEGLKDGSLTLESAAEAKKVDVETIITLLPIPAELIAKLRDGQVTPEEMSDQTGFGLAVIQRLLTHYAPPTTSVDLEKTARDEMAAPALDVSSLVPGEGGFAESAEDSIKNSAGKYAVGIIACVVLVAVGVGITLRKKPTAEQPVQAVQTVQATVVQEPVKQEVIVQREPAVHEEPEKIPVPKRQPVIAPKPEPEPKVEPKPPEPVIKKPDPEPRKPLKQPEVKAEDPWAYCYANFRAEIASCANRKQAEWKPCCLPPPPGEKNPIFRCRANTCDTE